MITPELKKQFLTMLEDARIQVEMGNVEGMAVLLHRIDHSNVGFTGIAPGSDACSLLGFAVVLLQGMIQFAQKTNSTAPEGIQPDAIQKKEIN